MATLNTKATAILWKTALGWLGALADAETLHRLTFGHAHPAQAVASLGSSGVRAREAATPLEVTDVRDAPGWLQRLRERLTAYAAGAREDFLDAPLHMDHLTSFQQHVVDQCRQIAYGHVISYGELAARAGSPRAARAVGNIMRSNRFPLIVPCHRVIASAGRIGGYSAMDGLMTKRRLLRMEGSWPA